MSGILGADRLGSFTLGLGEIVRAILRFTVKLFQRVFQIKTGGRILVVKMDNRSLTVKMKVN